MILKTAGGSPHFNIALEEALLEESAEHGITVARLWVNPDSIIVGYTSDVGREVNIEQASAEGVPVVRRISGGGAVFHDLGNVNVSVYIPRRLGVDEAYALVTSIILKTLHRLGIEGRVENGNDVAVGPWKVSGSAAAIRARATLAHATLLLTTDPSKIRRLVIPQLHRVERGEVTPVKYNPNSLERITGERMEVWQAARLLEESVKHVLGEPENVGHDILQEAVVRARELCKTKYSQKEFWSPLGLGTCREPQVAPITSPSHVL
ncbi:putative lipoate-protein ligase A [Aeropyrum pernix]|uniref:Putative lipoate-protein ligase A n=1 Tax=Aeropyrum pernix TaxID=56636 RepID=A0A401H7D2_AERPX|nr:biotin/lipoate A/B protein ligase family protein [Aeropyrum pernix]GBF08355.1 putative lipoate-protein ligase A [Aeropyrum pernix]